MKYDIGDHLVVRLGDKNKMILVTGKKIGLAPDASDEEAETIGFSRHDILANIGAEPAPGTTLFGTTYRPRRGLPVVDGMPKLVLFGQADLSKKIVKACKRILKVVEKNKFQESLQRCPEIHFVQLPEAKKTHTFKSKFQKEAWADQIIIYVDDNQIEEDIQHNLLRALGDSVFAHQIEISRHIKWLILFAKLRNVKRLSNGNMETLYDALIEQKDCTDAKLILSDELAEISDNAYKMVAKENAVSLRDLEKLVSEPEKLRDMWPTELKFTQGRPDIDKAALRSAQTLFSYSLTQYLTGTDVGKSLTKALKNTLKEF